MGLLTRSLALILGVTVVAGVPTPPTNIARSISGAPAAANAQLYDFGYSGSGCPQGSAKSEFDAAVDANRFYFPDVSAEIGPNVAQADQTNNCLLQISLKCDPGWKFTIKPNNIKLTARVQLQDGVAGSYITTYDIVGSAQARGVVRYDFTGPQNNSPSVADPTPSVTYPSSNCGGSILTVDRRVSLTKGSSSSPVGSIELYGDASSGGESNANFVPWGALEWSEC